MAEYTVEQFKAAARKAAQAGDVATARSLIARAQALEAAPTEPDGPTLGETALDVAKSAGAGVLRGASALADLPGAVVSGAQNLAARGVEAAGFPSLAAGMRAANEASIFQPDHVRAGVDMLTGGAPGYQAQTTAGEYAGTVGEFLPGGFIAGAPIAAGVVPGLLSEAAGQLTEGKSFPEWVPLVGGMDAEPAARFAGAVAGPMVANAARAAVTPNPADPARVAAAQRLNAEGVPVTAGQRTGKEVLKYREAVTPRTVQIVADQNQAFTRATLRRIGVEADRATPDVMRAAKTRAGQMFDDAIAGVQMTPTRNEVSGAIKTVRDYTNATAKSNISPIIRNTADRIIEAARKRKPISGADYQEWRSQLSRLTTSSDTQLANAAQDMIGVLDDAMEAGVKAMGQPERVAAFAAARRNWQDYLAIETAVSRAGEDAASGIISPQVLRNAIVQQGKRPYVLGQRELGELARDGATVTGKLPQTGAFPRTFDYAGGSSLGGGVGAATFGLTGDPVLSSAMGIAAFGLPTARNAMTGSAAGQAYLGNQLLTGRTPVSAALFPGATSLLSFTPE